MRRRAVIPISEQFLEQLLKLPEGTKILGFNANNDRFSIDCYVEGPAFDEVSEGVEAPVVNPIYRTLYPYYMLSPFLVSLLLFMMRF